MTDQPISPDVHASSGAYVVDALEPAERGEFERHLTTCAMCRAEITELSEAAAMLSLLTEQTPPPDLWAKTVAQTRTIRQLPPLENTPAGVSRVDELAVRRARRTATVSRWIAAAAAVVALAAGGGFVYSHQQLDSVRADRATTVQQLTDTQAQQDATKRLLAASDLKTARAPVTGGGTATVLSSAKDGQMLFVAAGLPTLAASKTYQLWLIDGSGKPVSAGTFGSTTGIVQQLVTGDLASTAIVGLTVEPSGGSKAPTTTPIFAPTLKA
jgi:anti-sigma-K factor RskA